jgi:hypothetical protein
MEQPYCKYAFSLADCGVKVKGSAGGRGRKGPKTGLDGLRGTNNSQGVLSMGEKKNGSTGAGVKVSAYSNYRLRLKVATGSRKAEELYREVKLFPPRIWHFGGFGWDSSTNQFHLSMKKGPQSRVTG